MVVVEVVCDFTEWVAVRGTLAIKQFGDIFVGCSLSMNQEALFASELSGNGIVGVPWVDNEQGACIYFLSRYKATLCDKTFRKKCAAVGVALEQTVCKNTSNAVLLSAIHILASTQSNMLSCGKMDQWCAITGRLDSLSQKSVVEGHPNCPRNTTDNSNFEIRGHFTCTELA
eukprot:m.91882 g.91882  ORF g.91882 m.91882 type:complete len:172 (-) comp12340_c0_seq1:1709-2224(-)